jgi:ligand-binding sensor domain-containing protein
MKSIVETLVTFIILISFSVSVAAQNKLGTWKSYSSYNSVTHIVTDRNNHDWISTQGGLFEVQDNDILQSLSTLDGLYSNLIRALTYDSISHGLWIGYIDGTLEFFDIENKTFIAYSDISRNSRYTSKTINNFNWIDDDLYISTEFGIVVWDAINHFVVTSYVNLGDLGNAIKTNQVLVLGDTLFAITERGLAYGNYISDDLILPQSWKSIEIGSQNLSREPLSMGVHQNHLFVSTLSENIRYENGRFLAESPLSSVIKRYKTSRGKFIAYSDRHLYEYSDSENKFIQFYNHANTLSKFTDMVFVSENVYYCGTNNLGLFKIDQGQLTDTLIPSGPFLNFFKDMKMDNSVLVSASSSSPGQVASTVRESGFYVFDGTEWESYNLANNSAMRTANAESFHKAGVGKDYYAFGSWGNGLAVFKKSDKTVQVFKSDNSPIPGFRAAPSFVVITGLQIDSNQKIWLTTLEEIVSYIPSEEVWKVTNKSPLAGINDSYNGLFVDSFNQFWIPLLGSRGMVLTTLDKDTQGSKDGLRLTSSSDQGFLPSDEVTAIAQDKRGEVWVGTTRGLVRYLFPDRIIGGNSNDRRAEYLRNVTNDSIYFRDIDVTAIAVDAANQKWIGTALNGLWHISENGDRILKRFSKENSPLPSNTIRSIAIDDKNGTVYTATDLGMVSYTDVTTTSYDSRETLKVFPNPFVYGKTSENRIVIEGLAQETTVRILSTSGFIIDEFSAKGGRVQWIPRTKQGKSLASGIYFVISIDVDGNETAVGKLAVVN